MGMHTTWFKDRSMESENISKSKPRPKKATDGAGESIDGGRGERSTHETVMSASDITEVGTTYIRPDSTIPSSVASTLIPTMGGVTPITSTEPNNDNHTTLIYPSSYPLDMGHKGQKYL